MINEARGLVSQITNTHTFANTCVTYGNTFLFVHFHSPYAYDTFGLSIPTIQSRPV